MDNKGEYKCTFYTEEPLVFVKPTLVSDYTNNRCCCIYEAQRIHW